MKIIHYLLSSAFGLFAIYHIWFDFKPVHILIACMLGLVFFLFGLIEEKEETIARLRSRIIN